VSGQLQDVFGHHQPHLVGQVGNWRKKEADGIVYNKDPFPILPSSSENTFVYSHDIGFKFSGHIWLTIILDFVM
jgi:hypothetical protein